MTATGTEMDDRRTASTGLLAALCLAAVGGLGWLVVEQPQRAWTPAPQVAVQFGDRHYRLDPAQAGWIEEFARLHFSAGQVDGRALLESELNAGLGLVFEEVIGRLPQFGDWYYSLGGEYARLSMAVLAGLDLAEDGFVAARAAEILFPAEAWENSLGILEGRVISGLRTHQETVREGWLAELAQRLEPHRVPAPVVGGVGAPTASVDLDAFGAQLLARERDVLKTRVALSTVAAGGVAAGTVWCGAAARAAARSGRAAAARGTSRGIARAGAAAGSGMTACAPAGPYALGCAVVAGAAAWLATDWALLRIDEAMNREALLAAMEAGVHELRVAMQEEMLAAYDAAAAEFRAGVEEEIALTFRPARAGGEAAAIVRTP
jgi:hypothetical protein